MVTVVSMLVDVVQMIVTVDFNWIVMVADVLLESKGIDMVIYVDWKLLDVEECVRGEVKGKIWDKFISIEAMMVVL